MGQGRDGPTGAHGNLRGDDGDNSGGGRCVSKMKHMVPERGHRTNRQTRGNRKRAIQGKGGDPSERPLRGHPRGRVRSQEEVSPWPDLPPPPQNLSSEKTKWCQHIEL